LEISEGCYEGNSCKIEMKVVVFAILTCLILFACGPGNLTHERYVFNNSGEDTIRVYNPDSEQLDTLYPGDTTLIYRYEMLDTQVERAACAWGGDTLLIYNQDDEYVLISVNNEDYWTTTIQGEKEKRQCCYFIITPEDFPE